VWDLAHRRPLEIRRISGTRIAPGTTTPDGRLLILICHNRTLRLLDAKNGRELAVLNGHTGNVTACAIAPDGRRAVSTSWDRTVRIWDLTTHACLVTHHGDAEFLSVAAGTTGIAANDINRIVSFLDWPPSMVPERAKIPLAPMIPSQGA